MRAVGQPRRLYASIPAWNCLRLASFVASKDLVLARICDIHVSLHTLATTVACLRRVTATSKSASALLLSCNKRAASLTRPRLRGQSATPNPRCTLHTHYLGPLTCNVSNDISLSHPSYNVTFCSTKYRLQSNSFHGIGAFELATTRHTHCASLFKEFQISHSKKLISRV